MARPWQTVARGSCRAGALELRRRGEDDYLITLAGRVLMNSRAQRSEAALAERGCAHLRGRAGGRVLVAGLGMGITLRCALDLLPRDARVTAVELNEVVADWCAGPLATLNRGVLEDPRVHLEIGDVATGIAEAARRGGAARFDAILLDLYEGPHARTDARRDPFFGAHALARSHAALRPGGVLAVWAEGPDRGFAERLRKAGFRVTRSRPGRGGLRHAVYLAARAGPAAAPAAARAAGSRP
jgi:spermidine synthase